MEHCYIFVVYNACCLCFVCFLSIALCFHDLFMHRCHKLCLIYYRPVLCLDCFVYENTVCSGKIVLKIFIIIIYQLHYVFIFSMLCFFKYMVYFFSDFSSDLIKMVNIYSYAHCFYKNTC